MFLTRNHWGIFALLLSFLTSCRPASEGSEASKASSNSQAVSENWSSSCVFSRDENGSLSLQTELKKTDSTLEVKVLYFIDQNCEVLLTSSTKEWSYSTEGENGSLKMIKLTTLSESTVFHNEGFVEIYNLLHPGENVIVGKNLVKEEVEFCPDYYSMIEEKDGQLKLYGIKANKEEGFSTSSNTFNWFYQ